MTDINLDMFPGSSDHISLSIPVPGWTAHPGAWKYPEQDIQVPVQNQVRAVQQALQAHQNNVSRFQSAIHHIRTVACPGLTRAVRQWQAQGTDLNRQNVQQAIQAIQQAGQNLSDAGQMVRTSRQQILDAEQALRSSVHPDQDIPEQMKQDVLTLVDFRAQVLEQAIRTEQNHQQARLEIEQVCQQTNQAIQGRA